jgi:hypothetical protein
VVKPNVGLAVFLYRPSWRMVGGGALLLALSFALWPTWVPEWLASLRTGVPMRVVPILTPAGPFLLLSLLRWRRPEARLLLGYACIPQAPWFYDQLILALIPGTAKEAMTYTLVTQVSLFAWFFLRGADPSHGTWLIAAALYLPLVPMILRRPNEGALPAWLRVRRRPIEA